MRRSDWAPVLLVQGIYLLAGWTKEEPQRHVVRLVDASKVMAVRNTLEPLTSYHMYSVQPSQPQVCRLPRPTSHV